MKNTTTNLGYVLACAVAVLLAAPAAFAQTTFTGSYTQNFDSMGSSGTAAPTGWSVVSEAGSHFTFAPAGESGTFTSINFTAGALTSEPTLTAGTPTTQKSVGGYNFSATGLTGVTGDRALGSSPTGTAGTALELSMTNNSGSAITTLDFSYDIDRFTTTTSNGTVASGSPNSGVEEFPGYQLFYNLTPSNNATWVNVSSLNPTINAGTGGTVDVPNTVGVTSITNATVTLNATWTAGGTISFAWFDDNAQDASPDQLIGLNNLSIAAVPEPSAGFLGLVAAGVALTLVRLRRQRA